MLARYCLRENRADRGQLYGKCLKCPFHPETVGSIADKEKGHYELHSVSSDNSWVSIHYYCQNLEYRISYQPKHRRERIPTEPCYLTVDWCRTENVPVRLNELKGKIIPCKYT